MQICKASHGIIQTEVDDIIPDSFDDEKLSEDEFFLLYDLCTSKNPDFPCEIECYGKSDLADMDNCECSAEFSFHKTFT